MRQYFLHNLLETYTFSYIFNYFSNENIEFDSRNENIKIEFKYSFENELIDYLINEFQNYFNSKLYSDVKNINIEKYFDFENIDSEFFSIESWLVNQSNLLNIDTILKVDW